MSMHNVKPLPLHPDLQGAHAAMLRAAQRARELAVQTHTPCYVIQDGELIDITVKTELNCRLTSRSS